MLCRELIWEAMGTGAVPTSEADARAERHALAVKIRRLRPSAGDAGTIYECLLERVTKWPFSVSGASEEVAFIMGEHTGSGDDHVAALRLLLDKEAGGGGRRVLLPWPQLDEACRPLLPGTVTFVVGRGGSGKSWFGTRLLIHCLGNGVQSSAVMLEENPEWHLRRNLALLDGNTNFLRQEWVEENPFAHRDAMERHAIMLRQLSDAIKVDKRIKLKDLVLWIKERCRARDRLIIVDPVTLADAQGMKPWESDPYLMGETEAACQASGSSIVFIVHPSKQTGRPSALPDMDQIAGSADLQRSAQNILWLWSAPRNTMGRFLNGNGEVVTDQIHKRIIILKTRNAPGEGKIFAMSFNKLSLDELGEEVADD